MLTRGAGGVFRGGGTILACSLICPQVVKRVIRALMIYFARQKAVERLDDRLRQVEDLCSALERDRLKLDLEFTDLYDKVRHQMSRMAKRDAVSQKENGEEVVPLPPDDPYSHLDSVSRGIMMRRAGQGIKK